MPRYANTFTKKRKQTHKQDEKQLITAASPPQEEDLQPDQLTDQEQEIDMNAQEVEMEDDQNKDDLQQNEDENGEKFAMDEIDSEDEQQTFLENAEREEPEEPEEPEEQSSEEENIEEKEENSMEISTETSLETSQESSKKRAKSVQLKKRNKRLLRADLQQLLHSKPPAHRIFYPYKALGVVIDSNPFQLFDFKARNSKKTKVGLVASQGKTLVKYEILHLRVRGASVALPHTIRAVAAIKYHTYAAYGHYISAFKTHRPLITVTHDANVKFLFPFGTLLISICEKNVLKVWTFFLGLLSEIQLPEDFTPTCLVHPPTYLDKVLISSREGLLQLWNIKTKSLIHTFTNWRGKVITSMSEAPALDVVALGLIDGTIIVHNIKYDKTIVSFKQTEGVVTSLSFRSDRGHPILASGTNSGSVVCWDLENKKIHSIISRAHETPITTVKFLVKEPVLVTSGLDNSLKMWVFDQSGGMARLLKERTGHAAPPTKIKFFSESQEIFTASSDRSLRYSFLNSSIKSGEVSQGKGLKNLAAVREAKLSDVKLPQIVDIDLAAKAKGWADIITAQEKSNWAATWYHKDKVIGDHRLATHCPNRTSVKAVTISACGNFGIIGSADGWIDKYNMQSGQHRGSFTDSRNERGFAHNGAITYLVTNNINEHLVSTSLDGFIKIWNLATLQLVNSTDVGVAIAKGVLHKENSLLALATDEFSIVVFDLETTKVIRKFEGHTAAITDFAFTPDSRWIVSASSDATLRVWDMPSAQLVDWYRFPKAITSLAFSPLGNFLVTTHVGNVGYFVWVNNGYYNKVTLRAIKDVPEEINLPTIGIEPEEGEEDDEDQFHADDMLCQDLLQGKECSKGGECGLSHDDKAIKAAIEAQAIVVEPTANEKEITNEYPPKEGLITLSNEPHSKWYNLPNWSTIKEHSKPTEGESKPISAPFFLPTIAGIETKFDIPEIDTDTLDGPASKLMKLQDELAFDSTFIRILKECDSTQEYTPVLNQLKKMSASAIEYELRSLKLLNDYEEPKMVMKMISGLLSTSLNFEIVESILALFLKIHGDIIIAEPELGDLAEEIKQKHEQAWTKLHNMFQNSLCLIKIFSGIQMT